MRIFLLTALNLISVNCSHSADCLQLTAHLSASVNTKCSYTEIQKLSFLTAEEQSVGGGIFFIWYKGGQFFSHLQNIFTCKKGAEQINNCPSQI